MVTKVCVSAICLLLICARVDSITNKPTNGYALMLKIQGCRDKYDKCHPVRCNPVCRNNELCKGKIGDRKTECEPCKQCFSECWDEYIACYPKRAWKCSPQAELCLWESAKRILEIDRATDAPLTSGHTNLDRTREFPKQDIKADIDQGKWIQGQRCDDAWAWNIKWE